MQRLVSEVALLAVEIAVEDAHRGVFESAGNNRGPEIDDLQRSANAQVGQPWCAKFVWWCFQRAASRLSVKNPFPRLFLSSALESWAVRENLIVGSPERGDVFVKERRHTGLATGPILSGLFVPAAEGNTYTINPAKEGVYLTKKTRAERCVFFRF